MSLSHADLRRLGRLAKLALDEHQLAALNTQLDNILHLVDEMQAVDTRDVAPMSHPLELTARLRADAPTEPDRRDAFQRVAPQAESGLYLVPKVIE
ncbi:MAG: Asp-tRNA(Asn)/Glu-tRNA(Gln) amidotransferase subunit GatC [Rhodocyclaceae bacterium]|nr:Asp-tRNA(Asn)/Glu-tRNA(Gln) amidotransferase subunit GatC [Rhodocyclaceae bacterium]MBR4736604.1 Asp-tRNA(Asn)/Glu-tRNA(Gln) amidotransferase subunit GatC [Rhodocyclaceae bacterium]